ncbi:MAG: SET domain-containing protein [Chitinophagaceae bacterium]|nr:SET domain-containing protein [Chitinophagaceae bacterium]
MIKTSISTPSSEVISKHIFADVVLNTETNQKALFAAVAFQPGDVITKFSADKIQKYATYLTLQTGTNRHITLVPEFLQYINHSCTPNAFLILPVWSWFVCNPYKRAMSLLFFIPVPNGKWLNPLFVIAVLQLVYN